MAGFGNTPVTTGTPVGTPIGEVAVPGHSGGDLTALRGASPSTDSNGNETAAVAAVIENANANGQATMANSTPVTMASDQTAMKVRGDMLSIAVAGTGTVNGINTFLVPATDVSGYRWGSLTVDGTFTLTFQAQSCNTNIDADYGAIPWFDHAAQTSSTNVALPRTVVFPIQDQFLRVKCTVFTSNASLAGTLNLFTQPPPIQHIYASQLSTWTVSTQVADLTLLASSAQTTTQTLADQSNPSARGVRVVLDMTTVGTGSVTLEIDAKDVASGKYLALLTGAAVTTNSTNVYIVHPDLTAAANSIAKDILPRTWRVKVVANNANSATYSVGASYLI